MTSLLSRDVGTPSTTVLLFGAVFASWLAGSSVFAQTILIPTISASETYDSNVFYTPKSLLSPGSKPEDLITQVTPQILVSHAGALMRGSLAVGGLITRYLENPDLNYTGVNAAGRLELKELAEKVSQRIVSLTLNGTYQFTPSLSTFGAANGGALGTGFGSTSVTSPLNVGLVTNRVSMHNANVGVTGGYLLTSTTTMTGSYNYTKLTFGGQSGGVSSQLFDTDGHQAAVTIASRISPRDTIGTTTTMSHYGQGQSAGSGTNSFTTFNGTANWARLWTANLSSSISGGGILVLPIESSIPGQSTKLTVAPTATVSMSYVSFSETLRAAGAGAPPGPFQDLPALAGSLNPGTVLPPGQYSAALIYNYSIFPSYSGTSGAMQTHVAGINARAGITSRLSGRVGVNYSHGATTNPRSSFDTLGTSVGASYLIGPVLASLSYDWLYFSSLVPGAPGVLDEVSFSKKIVMLSLSYAFTSQSFFRMGGLASVGTTGPANDSAVPLGEGAGGIPSGPVPAKIQ